MPKVPLRSRLFHTLEYYWSSLYDDIISYWRLDEQSGTRVDSVGSNDLTDNNTVGYVNKGPQGTSARFVEVNNAYLSRAAWLHGSSFTYTGWIRSNGAANYDTVLATSCALFPAWVQIAVYTINTDVLRAVITDDTGGNMVTIDSTVLLGTDWHFFAVWFDNSDKIFRLAVDRETPVAGAVMTGNLQNASPLTIGNADATVDAWDGDLANIGYWSVALSDPVQLSLYNNGNGKRYSELTVAEKVGLVSYWNLDEPSNGAGPVTRVDSVVTSGNNLTDNNTVTSVNTGPAGVVATLVAASNNFLSHPTGILNGLSSFAVSLWAKIPSGGTGGEVMFQDWDSAVTFSNRLRIYKPVFTNSWIAEITTASGVPPALQAGAIMPDDGEWHHVVAWYDEVDSILRVKIDDIATTDSVAGDVFNGDNDTYVGIYGSTISLSNVGVWNRVPSSAEISHLFNTGKGRKYSELSAGIKNGLIVYWDLDEVSGNRIDTMRYEEFQSPRLDLTDNNTVGSIINTKEVMRDIGAKFIALNSETLENVAFALGADADHFVSMWAKFNTLVASDGLYTISPAPAGDFTLRRTGAVIQLRTRGFADIINHTAVIETGSWYHICAWHNSVSNQLGIAVNGVIETAATGGPNNATSDLKIGYEDSSPAFSDAEIDEVLAYSRIPSQDEITELFQRGRGKFYPFASSPF